jgi:uncharacterized membrane protein YczE
MQKKNQKKRVVMTLIGVMLSGFSVGLFKMSLFGTDPFQCFAAGISNIITFINFGTLYTIINLIMLICIFFLDRHYIGIATMINIFGTGYIVEYTTKFLSGYFGDANLITRILLLSIGIVLMCFSSSLYYTADLGVSTYDAIALILADRKVGKFKYIRIGTDLICVIIGALLHAVVGVGTVITALFMGPLIEFFNVKFSRPFLEKGTTYY